jgi:hypothetical protein
MALVVAGIISTWWLRPVMGLTFDLLDILLYPLTLIVR